MLGWRNPENTAVARPPPEVEADRWQAVPNPSGRQTERSLSAPSPHGAQRGCRRQIFRPLKAQRLAWSAFLQSVETASRRRTDESSSMLLPHACVLNLLRRTCSCLVFLCASCAFLHRPPRLRDTTRLHQKLAVVQTEPLPISRQEPAGLLAV